MAEKKERPHNIVADNRKARFNYEIGEVFEAGMLPPAPFCAASGCVCWDREGPCRGFCAPAEQQVGALLIGSDAFFVA